MSEGGEHIRAQKVAEDEEEVAAAVVELEDEEEQDKKRNPKRILQCRRNMGW
jgi:hypothetical protein